MVKPNFSIFAAEYTQLQQCNICARIKKLIFTQKESRIVRKIADPLPWVFPLYPLKYNIAINCPTDRIADTADALWIIYTNCTWRIRYMEDANSERVYATIENL